MSQSYKRNDRQARGAFTLVELLVVIGIIVLLASLTIPSLVGLLSAGNYGQSFNMISAHLTAARAVAVRNNTFAGVHFQHAGSGNDPGEYYMMIVEGEMKVVDDKPVWTFTPAEGYLPRRLPGSMACGQISGDYVSDGGNYKESKLTNDEMPYFTSFTIMFSPAGQAVTSVNGQKVKFDASHAVFTGSDTAIWDADVANNASYSDTDSAGEYPVTALVIFDYVPVYGSDQTDEADRAKYLNVNGQFLPVNVYTGQLFPRE
jgi:prepilin-type N-terminal cleavage/methylation domain-containing protein